MEGRALENAEWIDCSVVRPKDGQRVIFVCKHPENSMLGYLNGLVMAGTYFAVDGCFATLGAGLDASHWMPAPEPPNAQ
ncbi:MAG: DUF551 domain-containing protein [Thiolinea sp.]